MVRHCSKIFWQNYFYLHRKDSSFFQFLSGLTSFSICHFFRFTENSQLLFKKISFFYWHRKRPKLFEQIHFSIFSHDTFIQSRAMFPFQSTHIILPMATVLTSLRLSFIALSSLWNASSGATKLCINSTMRVFKSFKELFPTKVGVVNRVQSILNAIVVYKIGKKFAHKKTLFWHSTQGSIKFTRHFLCSTLLNFNFVTKNFSAFISTFFEFPKICSLFNLIYVHVVKLLWSAEILPENDYISILAETNWDHQYMMINRIQSKSNCKFS